MNMFYIILKLNFSYSNDDTPTSLCSLSCANSEFVNIFQCDYNTTSSYLCNDNTDVSVTCCKLIYETICLCLKGVACFVLA